MGDFIRGTIALFNYCVKYNYNLYIDDEHEIFKNLSQNEIIIKNDKFNDTIELLPPKTYEQIDCELNELFLKNKSFCILTNAFYTKNSNNIMENFGKISIECKIFLRELFTPNNDLNNYLNFVYDTINIDLNKKYHIIHLRLGDNLLFNDTFDFNYFYFVNQKITSLLDTYKNQQFILLSDSSSIAIEIKKKNPELFYWDNKKIHMGNKKIHMDNIQDDTVKRCVTDTLVDFFIMTKCNKIFSYAYNGTSGFSKFISLIYDKDHIMI